MSLSSSYLHSVLCIPISLMGATEGNTTLFGLIFSSTQHGRFPAPALFKHFRFDALCPDSANPAFLDHL